MSMASINRYILYYVYLKKALHIFTVRHPIHNPLSDEELFPAKGCQTTQGTDKSQVKPLYGVDCNMAVENNS